MNKKIENEKYPRFYPQRVLRGLVPYEKSGKSCPICDQWVTEYYDPDSDWYDGTPQDFPSYCECGCGIR